MDKKVTYKEPKSYFTKSMLKAADDYDRAKKATTAQTTKPKATPKKSK